uniref:Odorant receptor 15 n=1 Tax=Ips typographus TaxID=55986 RepID=M3VK56_IPSTY
MLNNLVSSQLLLQEFCMTCVVCCSIYRSTSPGVSSTEMGYVSTMGIIAAIEMLTVSWFNQCFMLEVFELLNRIYELDWLNYNTKMRKMLVFLMQRVQRPYHFTMGLGFPLNLGVFFTMIKTSYSLYALLTNTGSKVST